MRIVHILLGKANPDSMNGVNKVVHHVATEQRRSGHDSQVWGLSSSWRTPARHAHEYPLRLYPVTRLRFTLAPGLARDLAGLGAGSWVHLHSVFIPEFRAVSASLRRHGLPFGVTPHGGYAPQIFARRPFVKGAYFRLVEATILRRAALVHAIGATEVEDLHRLVPGINVVLVPNGQQPLELDGIEPAPTPDGRPIVSYCGRLTIDHKGLDLLVAGFAEYVRAGGHGTLWLIGDGPDRGALRSAVAALGIADRVVFHGAHFGGAKMRLLVASDVFIHTSRWDVVPTAVLEAAALGLPLIVSRETNLGDAVEGSGAGTVLPVTTPEAIARALHDFEAAAHSGRSGAMGQRARRMVDVEFSWSRIADSLVDAYGAARTAASGRP
jgi:glycosyltransferase involved in cell wall biosynthesis